MVWSISLALLLGAFIFFLLRTNYLRWSDALLCSVFGFLVASTGLAPAVNAALTSLGHALGSMHP